MPRVRMPSGVCRRDSCLMVSAYPGASRSMASCVASGVTSSRVIPVPPVVKTKRAPPSARRAIACEIASRSSDTTSCTVSSPAASHSSTSAGPERSSPSPRAIVVEMVRTAARTRGSLVTRLGAMPAEDPDVAFVLRAFQAFEVQEGTLEEYFERFWVPDGVIEFVDGFPIRGSYRGVQCYKQWFADSYGPYEDVQRRLDSITKEGDRVVALLTVTGRPQGEDPDLEAQLCTTFALR